jgi:hypothetical protein
VIADSTKAYAMAKGNSIYLIYLPEGGEVQLDLGPKESAYSVRWYDPTEGGPLQKGSIEFIGGPNNVDLGTPPHKFKSD